MKDNKLIAEFMGLVVSDRENYTSELHTNIDADLKYHTDWNWLMPVVNKIESMKADFEVKSQWNEFINETIHQVVVKIEKGTMSKDRKCIYNNVKVYDYIGEASSDKKKAIYKAVVQFVKNYKTI